MDELTNVRTDKRSEGGNADGRIDEWVVPVCHIRHVMCPCERSDGRILTLV